MTDQSLTTIILELTRQRGILRPSDLREYQIPRAYLSRLVQRGLLLRTGRGLYILPDADLSRHHSLAEASRRVPHGTICLLSALEFHEMTSQLPSRVWMAIEPKARLPRVDHPALQIVRFAGRSLTEGVEEHDIEGVRVNITNPARTVADCFKYRNKIGVDVAVDALREYVRNRRGTMSELAEYARLCRVGKVMQPYLESLA